MPVQWFGRFTSKWRCQCGCRMLPGRVEDWRATFGTSLCCKRCKADENGSNFVATKEVPFMRTASFSLLTILCLMLAVDPAMADTLYDNGPYNGTTDAWAIDYGSAVSDSFTVLFDSEITGFHMVYWTCLLYTSPSPRDRTRSRM